jgi:hypothetical protein
MDDIIFWAQCHSSKDCLCGQTSLYARDESLDIGGHMNPGVCVGWEHWDINVMELVGFQVGFEEDEEGKLSDSF